MTGARMERNGQVRIVFACDRGSELGGLVEPVEIDRPALDASRDGQVEHFMRALAHRRGIEQAAQRSVARVHLRQNLPRSRPTTPLSWSDVGAPSGV